MTSLLLLLLLLLLLPSVFERMGWEGGVGVRAVEAGRGRCVQLGGTTATKRGGGGRGGSSTVAKKRYCVPFRYTNVR